MNLYKRRLESHLVKLEIKYGLGKKICLNIITCKREKN